jgi:1-acyl-sn-glycerol-3-phosphate acyltransferase
LEFLRTPIAIRRTPTLTPTTMMMTTAMMTTTTTMAPVTTRVRGGSTTTTTRVARGARMMTTTTSLSNHRINNRGRCVAPRAAMRASSTGDVFRRASVAGEDARRRSTTTARRGSVVTRAAGAAAAEGNSASGKGGFDFGARARAIAFFITSFSLAVPLITIMAIMFPFVWVFDRTRRSALSFCNDVWAAVSTGLFFPVQVFGRDNLPAADEAAVYVANHASFMDIYSLFHLRRPFKFISKTSNFLIPVVGWSMFLTGHVPLKRMERRSQMETLKKCREMLADGGSVLFFPEGTRSADGKMAAFKKGAFSVAAKENVPVIPITLVGAHEAMASGKEYELHNGGIKVIIHPRIQSTNADELCDQAEKIIKEALVNNS